MDKNSKVANITAVIVACIVVIFSVSFCCASEKSANTKETELDAYCNAVAETLNISYRQNGFELMGFSSKADTASFAIYTPYTIEEVKTLYAHDKQALRDLWGDIARTTWDYLHEQGIEVPADVDVTLQVYAADSKECIVYLTKHDTKLQV